MEVRKVYGLPGGAQACVMPALEWVALVSGVVGRQVGWNRRMPLPDPVVPVYVRGRTPRWSSDGSRAG